MGNKCIFEKKVKFLGVNLTFKFRVRQPTRNPEMEEVAVVKYHLDVF